MASLAAQTFIDYEWVIVDGASTDKTLELVKGFDAAPVTQLSEPDKGIYDAMNKGVGLAKGDYVFFLNSDDALHDPEVLADMASRLDSDPTIEVLYGNVVYDQPGRQILRTFSHINRLTLPFEDLCHQAVFARRSLFATVGLFNKDFHLNADYDWLIRVFRSGAKCIWVDRTVALFTVGGAHIQDPKYLATERKLVRLQYMSKATWLAGDFLRRVRHRLNRIFCSHPLGQIPLSGEIDNPEIVLLPHGFQPEYEAGFANGLARNGWAVTLIGSDMSLSDRLDANVQLLNLRGSQDAKRSRWQKAFNMLRYWLTCYAYLLTHRRAVVHQIGTFSTGNLRLSLIEAWLHKLLAGRYVMTVHNLLPHDRHSEASFRLSRAIYQTADICMVHTASMRDSLVADFGIERSRIVIVEHGIDRILPVDAEAREAMRRRLQIKPDEKLLLFFGNLAKYKGADVLIQSFDRLAGSYPVRLVIAGRCRSESLKEELRQQITTSRHAQAIQWLEGYFPENEVPAMFHAADLLVMPYRHIDQSGVVFMALATGLPVVASDVGSLRNYIPDGFGCVVPPEDEAALAEGIASALNQQTASEKQLTLASNYLWSSVVRPLLPIYRLIKVR